MAGCGSKKGYKEGGKVFSGISKDTEKAIEDALSEAMSDPKKNPTSKYNTLKGRNNTMKRKPRSEIARFSYGGEVRQGDVRDNSKRGQCY